MKYHLVLIAPDSAHMEPQEFHAKDLDDAVRLVRYGALPGVGRRTVGFELQEAKRGLGKEAA